MKETEDEQTLVISNKKLQSKYKDKINGETDDTDNIYNIIYSSDTSIDEVVQHAKKIRVNTSRSKKGRKTRPQRSKESVEVITDRAQKHAIW